MSKAKNKKRKHIEVVAAAVVHDGFVLAVQRGKGKYVYTDHKWEFPGGKMEPGESEEAALRRELREEMNYEVVPQERLLTVTHSYPDFDITLHVWICSPADDAENFELKEHASSAWLRPDELGDPDWCAADERVVEALKARYGQSEKVAEEVAPAGEEQSGGPTNKELWLVLALVVVMTVLYFVQRR